mmetsp:Transcript_6808/g.11473  ORF Transcript_6808/g.11473 Transcript_6808/m.11473 type:complete len:432 (+) Transcript_6808:297-1592(+)
MPWGLQLKYGNIYSNLVDHENMMRRDETELVHGRPEMLRGLSKLMTNEEKEALQAEKDELIRVGDNIEGEYSHEGYMKRQPRFDLKAVNYNIEEFRQFTQIYERSKKKDDEESLSFYKMAKYVKNKLATATRDQINADMIVRDFAAKYRVDLIEIPEEFKDVEVEEGFKPIQWRRNITKRKYIKSRNKKPMYDYDAWRCFDRQLLHFSHKDPIVTKIMVPPALLVRAFGSPDRSHLGFWCTGHIDFEDANLDLFRLYDYKETDFYHGLNREAEYYDKLSNLKKPERKRRRMWPTITEFWELEEPREFRMISNPYSEWKRFRKWFKRELLKVEDDPSYDYDKMALAKYEADMDVCLLDYDKKGEVHTDVAVYKWNYHNLMTEEEIKNMSDDLRLETPEPPKCPADFSKVQRHILDKDALAIKEMQAEQERMS